MYVIYPLHPSSFILHPVCLRGLNGGSWLMFIGVFEGLICGIIDFILRGDVFISISLLNFVGKTNSCVGNVGRRVGFF